MITDFSLLSAVTAAGSELNEDAYGLWPDCQRPRAAWVLDGVTGINDRALLPGPSDAAWLVAQVQELLPPLLAATADRPATDLVADLTNALQARQNASWLNAGGPDGRETPAASFAMTRQLGDTIEIARLGDCPVLLERTDGSIDLLDDPVLCEIEADTKARIVAMRTQGISDDTVIRHRMMPALRAQRARRNIPGGYGVLAAEKSCRAMLQVDRFPAASLRSILLASDGYYRLVDVYGAMSDADLIRGTAERGAETLLAELRAIEAADPTGAIHPRLKMADDATVLLLRRVAA